MTPFIEMGNLAGNVMRLGKIENSILRCQHLLHIQMEIQVLAGYVHIRL